ncbi:unnamed protein product [Rangifer tarandus platyrhynchus]|uniref:Uncharacterized protein n=2 Tax=Rangifer tarandus platyrhynchus TaxID=3082113 RepID=A0ABN8YYT7_RANTA|nr:unnamed protein product [Rangifer tarandus platyrhynchus]
MPGSAPVGKEEEVGPRCVFLGTNDRPHRHAQPRTGYGSRNLEQPDPRRKTLWTTHWSLRKTRKEMGVWTPLQRWAPGLGSNPASSSYQLQVRGDLASPGLMSAWQGGSGQSSRKIRTQGLYQCKGHSLP